jgi:hypothetical protein
LDAYLHAQVVCVMQIRAGKMRCNWTKTIGIGTLKLMILQMGASAVQRRTREAHHRMEVA